MRGRLLARPGEVADIPAGGSSPVVDRGPEDPSPHPTALELAFIEATGLEAPPAPGAEERRARWAEAVG